MERILQPHQFRVNDGQKIWAGQEIIEFFKFDPQKCKIELKDMGVHITQEGCSSLILAHGLEILQSSEAGQ